MFIYAYMSLYICICMYIVGFWFAFGLVLHLCYPSEEVAHNSKEAKQNYPMQVQLG